MLIDFFYTLRAAKLPVSVKEFLTLLEALKRTQRLQDRRFLPSEPRHPGQGRKTLRQV